MHKDYLYTNIVYTQILIHSAEELEQCRMNKLAQGLTWQHRIQTWVFLVKGPEL